MHLAAARQPGSQEARLHYRRLAQLPRASLLQVTLETGSEAPDSLAVVEPRPPQFWGIRKYGSRETFAARNYAPAFPAFAL